MTAKTINIGEKMNQNIHQSRKKSFISTSFKFMLAAASIAGTVGLWGVFSKKDAQASANALSDSPLPTIETLVPFNTSGAAALPTSDTSISSLPVVTQAPKNYTSQGGGQLAQPSPVTNTKSSRP
jgi:hypothetical protein